jgi:hypothetical protein
VESGGIALAFAANPIALQFDAIPPQAASASANSFSSSDPRFAVSVTNPERFPAITATGAIVHLVVFYSCMSAELAPVAEERRVIPYRKVFDF